MMTVIKALYDVTDFVPLQSYIFKPYQQVTDIYVSIRKFG